MSQTDMDIALTSKRINMTLDDFIKESKIGNKKHNNRNNNNNNNNNRGNNRNRASNNRRFNNNNNNNNSNTNNNRNNNRNNNNNNFKKNNNKDVQMKTFSSPRVKKTLALTSPQKRNTRSSLISPEKIKIQIQNKTNLKKPAVGGLNRPKLRAVGGSRAPRINLTRTSRPAGPIRTKTTATKKPTTTRLVQRYEKPVTLNDRFSKK